MRQRRRLDLEMVRRCLAPTRSQAQALIAAGRVRVSGAVAAKPSRLVAPAEALHVVGTPPRYVSRGGLKLEAALAGFGIDPSGMRAIDVGSSTGGFTDCLLQHGAIEVVAVDVGRCQLHERLRADRRVVSYERTDVRAVDLDAIGGPAALVTADLSFISLRRVAADLYRLATAEFVLLVKPQFEAGRAEADRGRGVISDPGVWQSALLGAAAAMSDVGVEIRAVMVSPVVGAAGNVEFFMHADVRSDVGGLQEDGLSESVGLAVCEASGMVGGGSGVVGGGSDMVGIGRR